MLTPPQRGPLCCEQGEIEFAPGVVLKGTVTIKNTSNNRATVPAGTYENTTVEV